MQSDLMTATSAKRSDDRHKCKAIRGPPQVQSDLMTAASAKRSDDRRQQIPENILEVGVNREMPRHCMNRRSIN